MIARKRHHLASSSHACVCNSASWYIHVFHMYTCVHTISTLRLIRLGSGLIDGFGNAAARSVCPLLETSQLPPNQCDHRADPCFNVECLKLGSAGLLSPESYLCWSRLRASLRAIHYRAVVCVSPCATTNFQSTSSVLSFADLLTSGDG